MVELKFEHGIVLLPIENKQPTVVIAHRQVSIVGRQGYSTTKELRCLKIAGFFPRHGVIEAHLAQFAASGYVPICEGQLPVFEWLAFYLHHKIT